MPKPTLYQRLQATIMGVTQPNPQIGNTYNITQHSNDVIATARSKEEYDQKLLQLQQSHLLAKQWVKTSYDVNTRSLAGLNDVRLMYRDCDLMDGFPEFGTALDIFAEETCSINEEGHILNIDSKSERIKAVLEDLFVNRLSIDIMLPMITRCMCKYGNDFMLLNITDKNGILGWKELPVYELERYEDGMAYPYTAKSSVQQSDERLGDTRYVWVASSQTLSYKNFQMAHFRLLYDSLLLPYGVSIFNKARRHFRLLSMMEDSMLIYRLERSMERRVFKIPVGAIDDQDVEPFIQEVANRFKRTPIIDPETGQIDTRKNILNSMEDYFIPIIPGQDYTPIEVLQAGQNLTAMDDITYMQNKICTALRVPRSYLNFEETTGEGKNLSLMDVRFTKTVYRIQQALLMELNKIAIIHLTLLGFHDDVTNFKLSMNNPSSQAEMLELDNLAKKITTAKDAASDVGGGMPLMSLNYVWKHIFHWSEKDIRRNLEELRLENALANELQKTSQLIKRTGIFDSVDNIYAEPDAQYIEEGPEGQGGPEGGMPPMGGGGGLPPMGGGGLPPMGGDLDFGEGEELEGAEGEMPIEAAANEDMGGAPSPAMPPMGENTTTRKNKKVIDDRKSKNEPILSEKQQNSDLIFQYLTEKMVSLDKPTKTTSVGWVPLLDKNYFINEELNKLAESLKAQKDIKTKTNGKRKNKD